VVVEHGSLTDHLIGFMKGTRLETCASIALISSMTADAGHNMLLSSLLLGSILHVLSEDVAFDGHRLAAYLIDHEVECFKIVPSLWLSYCGEGRIPVPRKCIMFGGEASL
jgi:hypothetical protein